MIKLWIQYSISTEKYKYEMAYYETVCPGVDVSKQETSRESSNKQETSPY